MKSLKTPKGGNQNQYIEEEQTTQRQKKKYKRTNNDLQNIPEVNSGTPEGQAVPAPLVAPVVLIQLQTGDQS